MENIAIPLVEGNEEDVHCLGSINYGLLSKDLKEIEGNDYVIAKENLKKREHELFVALEKTRAPNAKVHEEF